MVEQPMRSVIEFVLSTKFHRWLNWSSLKGNFMNVKFVKVFSIFALGAMVGAATLAILPSNELKAVSANSNDKFSMATVTVSTGIEDTEAIFILDHLTGLLRGGFMNPNGQFAYTYFYNVAGDFQINPATPEPKYCIVAGRSALRSAGGSQPANGVVYVAELTSGNVIAYGFPAPRGRGSAAPIPMIRLDGFGFREAVGG